MTEETSVIPPDFPEARKNEFDTIKLAWLETLTPAKVADVSATLPYESKNTNENMQGTPAMAVLALTFMLVVLKLREAGRTVNMEKNMDRGRNELSSGNG